MRSQNVEAFSKRLSRVARGEYRSAIDEFLGNRVPVQLGGLQDPFTSIERHERVTFKALKVLREYQYPTLISTKGQLVGDGDYLSLLREMNVSVRLSAAGVREDRRHAIERGCAGFSNTLRIAQKLASQNIAVTLRIQPIIPGQEEHVLKMIHAARDAGVRHISLEYLKLPIETKDRTNSILSAELGYDVRSFVMERGCRRVGPDLTLSADYKVRSWMEFSSVGRSLGMTMGAGDTELIHLSDGNGCCNGAGLYLRDCSPFTSNFTGILKGMKTGDDVSFSKVLELWSPKAPISTYLMTDSRVRDTAEGLTDWQSLMAARWEAGRSVYSPAFFAGVTATTRKDNEGRTIYAYAGTS